MIFLRVFFCICAIHYTYGMSHAAVIDNGGKESDSEHQYDKWDEMTDTQKGEAVDSAVNSRLSKEN